MMRSYQVKLHSVEEVKELVNIVSKYGYDVALERDGYKVDAKSIMGVLSLGLDETLTLIVDTDNVVALKNELSKLLV